MAINTYLFVNAYISLQTSKKDFYLRVIVKVMSPPVTDLDKIDRKIFYSILDACHILPGHSTLSQLGFSSF